MERAMIRVALLLLFVLLQVFWLPEAGIADTTNLSREQIRSLPITERPSRPGHVYGNTVRRLKNGRPR